MSGDARILWMRGVVATALVVADPDLDGTLASDDNANKLRDWLDKGAMGSSAVFYTQGVRKQEDSESSDASSGSDVSEADYSDDDKSDDSARNGLAGQRGNSKHRRSSAAAARVCLPSSP